MGDGMEKDVLRRRIFMVIDIHDKEETTVNEWLQGWLDRKYENVQASTHQNYTSLLRPVQQLYVNVPLVELSTEELQTYIDLLLEAGLYSAAWHVRDLLKAALDDAVRMHKLCENPARKLMVPYKESQTIKALTKDMQQLFLKSLENERTKNLFAFQLLTGLRPGEVCALQWSDIDWDNKTVVIQRNVRRVKDEFNQSRLTLSPTKNGCNRILLLSDTMLILLRNQKLLQQKEICDGGYQETQFVFTTKNGTLLESTSLNRTLKKVQKKMSERDLQKGGSGVIPAFTAHSLRHTFATRALEANVPPKVLAYWLGHKTVRITLDVYQHILPEFNQSSVEKMDEKMQQMCIDWIHTIK